MGDDRPTVFLVDDESQVGPAAVLESLGVHSEWLHPLQVTPQHFSQATLFAVDQYFDLLHPESDVDEDFIIPPGTPESIVPRDGLALSAVLRSASKESERKRPVGISLRSGDLDKLTLDIPQGIREPLVAAQHDLEWVVAKADSKLDSNAQLVSLANALHRYPTEWPTGRVRDIGAQWIGIPDLSWGRIARKQIEQCRPPVVISKNSSHGLAWLRWLAHRALPFPTFLLSQPRVAAMLGVTATSLDSEITNGGSPVSTALKAAVYDGPLAGLQKRRYWRAGVFHLVLSFVDEDNQDDVRRIGEAICRVSTHLEMADIDDAVVCIDADYRETGEVIPRVDAVRLIPEGWPAFADPAWASATEANKSDMADLLAPGLR